MWVAPLPSSFVDALPSSIYSARKMAESERDRFDRYVCCPGCHSLYSLDECVVRMVGGDLVKEVFIYSISIASTSASKACGKLVMKSRVHPKGPRFIPNLYTATKV